MPAPGMPQDLVSRLCHVTCESITEVTDKAVRGEYESGDIENNKR
jgi:hypothetical protein